MGLQKGYAYALSDKGWFRFTIINGTEDKYFESRRRILQLTNYTQALLARTVKRPRAPSWSAAPTAVTTPR